MEAADDFKMLFSYYSQIYYSKVIFVMLFQVLHELVWPFSPKRLMLF